MKLEESLGVCERHRHCQQTGRLAEGFEDGGLNCDQLLFASLSEREAILQRGSTVTRKLVVEIAGCSERS